MSTSPCPSDAKNSRLAADRTLIGYRRTWQICLLLAGLLSLGLVASTPALQAQGLTEGYALVDEWTSVDISGEVPNFGRPNGIDVASDGTVYVIDGESDRVFHVQNGGRSIDTWNVSGIGDPKDIAVNDTAVFVISEGGGRIYDRDGSNPRPFAVTDPESIASGPDGKIYVSRLNSWAEFDVFNPDGSSLANAWRDERFPLFELDGMDVAPDGKIYVAAGAAIYEATPGGPGGVQISNLLRTPSGVAGNVIDVGVDAAGNIYGLLSTARVLSWSSDGSYRDRFQNGSRDRTITGARWMSSGPANGLVISTFTNGFAGITFIPDRNDFQSAPVRWGDDRMPIGAIIGPAVSQRAQATSSICWINKRWFSIGTALANPWNNGQRAVLPPMSVVAGTDLAITSART